MKLAAAGIIVALVAAAGCAPRSDSADRVAAAEAPATPARRGPVVENVEAWSYAGKPGRVVTTQNYRLYSTMTDQATLSRLPEFLEAALEQYRLGIARLPAPPLVGPQRLETFVLATRSQWETLTRQLLGDGSGVYLSIPRGGYAWGGKSVLYDIGAGGTFTIAAHEGWHQYTQRTFKDPLPAWLEEGVATFMEGHRWSGATPVFLGWANLERFDQLRDAAATGSLLSLEDLLAGTPQGMIMGASTASDGALTWYAQAWALVHYLREGDRGTHAPALNRLLSDAAEGRLRPRLAMELGPEAAGRVLSARRGRGIFEVYFGRDLERVSQGYDQFVADVVRTGSRQAVAEGRNPLSP
ncbi:MAG: DUF1570 domain-containing protein [Phycisphaeraceae bacterium]|nr:DUF1570 domain-containing protein [Phycisphaeraceae bacterium]